MTPPAKILIALSGTFTILTLGAVVSLNLAWLMIFGMAAVVCFAVSLCLAEDQE